MSDDSGDEDVAIPSDLIFPSPTGDAAAEAKRRVRAALEVIKANLDEDFGKLTLQPPASEEQLAAERLMPEDLKELYRIHNGQLLVDKADIEPVGSAFFPKNISFLPLERYSFTGEPDTGKYIDYLNECDEDGDDEESPSKESTLGDLPKYQVLGHHALGEFYYGGGTCNNLIVEHYMNVDTKELVHEVFYILDPTDEAYEEMAFVPFQCGPFVELQHCVKGRLKPSAFRFTEWLEAYAASLVNKKDLSYEEAEKFKEETGWEDGDMWNFWHCHRPKPTLAKSAVA